MGQGCAKKDFAAVLTDDFLCLLVQDFQRLADILRVAVLQALFPDKLVGMEPGTHFGSKGIQLLLGGIAVQNKLGSLWIPCQKEHDKARQLNARQDKKNYVPGSWLPGRGKLHGKDIELKEEKAQYQKTEESENSEQMRKTLHGRYPLCIVFVMNLSAYCRKALKSCLYDNKRRFSCVKNAASPESHLAAGRGMAVAPGCTARQGRGFVWKTCFCNIAKYSLYGYSFIYGKDCIF